MNILQSNLYEILDALQINAQVGEGVFNITTGIKIDNGYVKVNFKPEAVFITETKQSTFVILRIGNLGLIAVATKGFMARLYTLDFAHPDAIEYIQTKDYNAMLMHVTKSKNVEWVLDTIPC